MGDGVFDTKKHTNIKRKAEYRRIGKYYKSPERFKAEKDRRKRILELQDQGLTVGQIAGQLNVSERTVERDLAAMRLSINRHRTRLIRQASEEELGYFNGLSLKGQLDYLCRLRDVKKRVLKIRSCKSLVITLSVDKAFGGRYVPVKFKPDLPVEVLDNGRITIELEACGRKQPVARIYVGKITSGSLNLQTNQSMNQFVTSSLRGLQVVESKSIEPAG